MKLLFVSAHAFLPATRKTSVHFVSEALAERGHTVETISVGYSCLTRFKNAPLHAALAATQRNRFAQRTERYRSACHMPLLHPFSSGYRPIDFMTAPAFALYGRMVPRFMKAAIRRAEIIFLESGTPLAFFDAMRRINPGGRLVYFARDRLDTVGASRYLQKLERRILPEFDLIIVPSEWMADHLAGGARVAIVPQGIDRKTLDACQTSPYGEGTVNGVSVGDMLFDHKALAAMAQSAPEARFHIFGAGIEGDFPANVTLYGERPFAEIAPYIKFATFGIAPYRLTQREAYLVQSSLKLRQYAYCGLPVLAPAMIGNERGNIIGYEIDDERNWGAKLKRAMTMRHEAGWKCGIPCWDEVAALVEAEITTPAASPT